MRLRLALARLTSGIALGAAMPAWGSAQDTRWLQTDDGPVRRGQVPADTVTLPLAPGTHMPGGGPPPPTESLTGVDYVAAIRISDGRYDATRSLPASVRGGRRGDTAVEGISIISDRPNLNGVLVQGKLSAVTLSDARLSLGGTGSNDFLGIGAGAMVTQGVLVLRHVSIATSGAVRSAVVANDHAIMKVFDSDIVSHGGPLPAGYVHHVGPGMMEAPPPLGITGTARANLTMGQSESYFYRTRITTDGWGALSTDATGGYVYLEANDCVITVNNSGYGTYADGGAHVAINRSRIDAATFGAIAAGSGDVRFTDVTGHAGRDAIMIHSVMGIPAEVGRFSFHGGSFDTQEAAILVKSANAEIDLDHVMLRPANGTLIQAIVNDDADRTKVNGQPVPGITVTMKNGSYSGAVLMQDGERTMTLHLSKARLAGAIRDAAVILDGDSHWTATGNSVVTLADPAAVGRIDAPAGVTITVHGRAIAAARLPGGGRLVLAS